MRSLDAGRGGARVDSSSGLVGSGVGRVRSVGGGLGGERVFESLAEGDAMAKQAGPFGGDLLVDAIEEENEKALQRGEDGEENLEDGDDVGVGDQEHEVSKNPGETDRNVDGNVDAEFLLSIALIGLGSSGQGLVDFTTNEEEEDTVRRDDDETGDEEAKETEEIAGDPALGIAGASTDGTIRFSGSRDDDEDGGKSPREDVIPLLQELGLAISSHDHLVEVEGNTECPTEVR